MYAVFSDIYRAPISFYGGGCNGNLYGFIFKKMSKELYKGDKVTLLDSEALMKVLQKRKFSLNDSNRRRIADELGGREGFVDSIEEKYSHDYFFFRFEGGSYNYSIPYEAVDFSKKINS